MDGGRRLFPGRRPRFLEADQSENEVYLGTDNLHPPWRQPDGAARGRSNSASARTVALAKATACRSGAIAQIRSGRILIHPLAQRSGRYRRSADGGCSTLGYCPLRKGSSDDFPLREPSFSFLMSDFQQSALKTADSTGVAQ